MKRTFNFSASTAKTIFFVCLLLSASGLASPLIALLGGIAFGFAFAHPYRSESSNLAKLLLQASVIALGFGMNLKEVIAAGKSGFVYTAASIITAIALGLMLGKLFQTGNKISFLISAGTAICGGSAIAAIAPITNPNEEEISVAMGTIFLLNSVALILFPIIGSALHLSQNQFGLWAALAIHDTSSVVGATAKYGNQALAIGTTVKLARALWIVPTSVIAAMFVARAVQTSTQHKTQSRVTQIKIPWFILFFCVAAAANTYVTRFAGDYVQFNHLGKIGLTATLFLIGTRLSKQTFKQVGIRPFMQGVILWIVVASISLFLIYRNFISI